MICLAGDSDADYVCDQWGPGVGSDAPRTAFQLVRVLYTYVAFALLIWTRRRRYNTLLSDVQRRRSNLQNLKQTLKKPWRLPGFGRAGTENLLAEKLVDDVTQQERGHGCISAASRLDLGQPPRGP